MVPEIFRPSNRHEAYLFGLKSAGLIETALAADWVNASSQSLIQPQEISTGYQEVFYLDPSDPEALGYVFETKRGQKIKIDLEPIKADSLQLFMDLFRYDSLLLPADYEHVASAEESEQLLAFEPRSDGKYILRIQPELLRGGSFSLHIEVVPSLDFPVMDKNRRSIGSFFGDPRDGGRRKHHGIDIFAKRHTPVLAPTDGYIRFAGERGLGGQVVWMRDPQRDMTLYFAHLHTITARDDTWVKAGDTLGTVGNTGNARTTPPHLHFGIYQDGPIDPYYFVADESPEPRKIRSDLSLVGKKIRAKRSIRLVTSDRLVSDTVIELEQYQLMEVQAAVASGFRVKLPNGQKGFVAMNEVESIDRPIRTNNLPKKPLLLPVPGEQIVTIEQLETNEQLEVLARDMQHWFVRTDKGSDGWIEALP